MQNKTRPKARGREIKRNGLTSDLSQIPVRIRSG